MTALQTFPATTSTGTTEIDHSHYGRGDLGFKDHRSFATMDQIRDEPRVAPSTEATSSETKNYGTIASTLHHLEQTEQVAAPEERSESIPQARLESEDSAQATALDRRKDGEQEENQQRAAGDADDGKTLSRGLHYHYLCFRELTQSPSEQLPFHYLWTVQPTQSLPTTGSASSPHPRSLKLLHRRRRGMPRCPFNA